MIEWLKIKWCSWTHGGGHIKRNDKDEIDWQCCKCKRWSGGIPREAEEHLIYKNITRKLK